MTNGEGENICMVCRDTPTLGTWARMRRRSFPVIGIHNWGLLKATETIPTRANHLKTGR